MAMDFQWSQYSPIDNTGTQRSVFKSAYKNVRFTLIPQESYTLSEADAANLPGLSYQIYGTMNYWHILLAYNGLDDPIQDVVAGITIIIPTKTSIDAYLTQQQNNQPQVLNI